MPGRRAIHRAHAPTRTPARRPCTAAPRPPAQAVRGGDCGAPAAHHAQPRDARGAGGHRRRDTPRRRVQHAPPAHGRRHDGGAVRRGHTAAAAARHARPGEPGRAGRCAQRVRERTQATQHHHQHPSQRALQRVLRARRGHGRHAQRVRGLPRGRRALHARPHGPHRRRQTPPRASRRALLPRRVLRLRARTGALPHRLQDEARMGHLPRVLQHHQATHGRGEAMADLLAAVQQVVTSRRVLYVPVG